MNVLDAFLAWVRDQELSGDPDARTTADEMAAVVRRIAESGRHAGERRA